MRLLDFIVNLSKSQPEIYGFSQLLSIVDKVRSLGYDIYSDFKSDKYSEELIESLHLLNSGCESCSLCTGRTNVALPDGYINSDIFMVTDYPEIIDDRTGVIGSTIYELESSGCSTCFNFSGKKDSLKCYIEPKFDYKSSPIQSCNYIPLESEQITTLSAKQLADVTTPFSIINNCLNNSGVKRKYNHPEKGLLNIYITSVFKCLGAKDKSFEELLEESTCQKIWLENERLLSNAPYTIVLGVETAKLIFGKRRNFKGRTNKIISIDSEIDWGQVIILDHPRNLNSEEQIEFINNLTEFLEFLKTEKEDKK